MVPCSTTTTMPATLLERHAAARMHQNCRCGCITTRAHDVFFVFTPDRQASSYPSSLPSSRWQQRFGNRVWAINMSSIPETFHERPLACDIKLRVNVWDVPRTVRESSTRDRIVIAGAPLRPSRHRPTQSMPHQPIRQPITSQHRQGRRTSDDGVMGTSLERAGRAVTGRRLGWRDTGGAVGRGK